MFVKLKSDTRVVEMMFSDEIAENQEGLDLNGAIRVEDDSMPMYEDKFGKAGTLMLNNDNQLEYEYSDRPLSDAEKLAVLSKQNEDLTMLMADLIGGAI